MTPKKLHYIFESATAASPDPLCKNRAEANFMPSKCRRWVKGTQYRQLIIPPVRIFYRAQNEVVYIVYAMRGERLFRSDDLLERDMG